MDKKMQECLKGMAALDREHAERCDKRESRCREAGDDAAADDHKADAAHLRKRAAHCEKAAASTADPTDTHVDTAADMKAVNAKIDGLAKKFDIMGQQWVPTAAHGVLPDIPAGISLVKRSGGASLPVTNLPPELAELVTE